MITLPLLILIGLPVPVAIATNRVNVVFLELASAIKFHKSGKLDLKKGLGLGVIAGLGSLIGARLVLDINETYLNLIVASLFTLVFVFLLTHKKIKKSKIKKISWPLVILFTFILGIYGGFLGPGFGTFIAILMVFCGETFVTGSAIARVVGFMMSSFAAVFFILHGEVLYFHALALGLGCVIGSWFGIGFALKKGEKYIKSIFIFVVIASMLKLVWQMFN